MAFLRNDAINRVNLHSGIQALAHGAGGIFFLVILLRAGVSAPAALVAQAAILIGRFVLRPAILPLAKRWGLKPLLVVGTVGMALQYPLLAEVRGVDRALLVLCATTSIAEVFYWVAYNAYFAALGDAEFRGHQIGAREALVAVAGIVAPALGALAIATVGTRWTLAGVGLVQAAAAIPLLGVPNVAIMPKAPGTFRTAGLAVSLMTLDGWFDASFLFVWQIALFLSLGESISAYGGAMAAAGLVGAVCGLFLGRRIDAGHGRKIAVVAYGAVAAVVLLRAASLGSPWLAVGANALGALVMPLLIPALASATYNLAKASPCPLRFQLATEAGWDIGCGTACLCSAALTAAGVPLSASILLALPGIAASTLLLRRYYAAKAAAQGAAAPIPAVAVGFQGPEGSH
jgi:Major Facilitator Superfamily